MGYNWYVARTEPRAEALAACELGREGYETFLPRVRNPQSGIGNSHSILFPGYLFLRFDPELGGWPFFRQSHRILGWLRFGGEVPCLPDNVVAEIKERIEQINLDGGLRQRFQPGDEVRLTSESLHCLAQVVEDKKPDTRVKVLLRFMGRLVSTQVPREDLQLIGNEPWEKQRFPRRTRGKGRRVRPLGALSASSA